MSSFHPEDPRLTAYVLGELSADERAEIEQLLHESPEARKAVEEIQNLTDVLLEQLPHEPAPQLQPAQRAVLLSGSPESRLAKNIPTTSRSGNSAVAVTACLMVAISAALLMFNQDSAEGTRESLA